MAVLSKKAIKQVLEPSNKSWVNCRTLLSSTGKFVRKVAR